MSATEGRSAAGRLHLVASPSGVQDEVEAHGEDKANAAWSARRPALLRLCAGEPLLVTDDEIDLVALVNRAREVNPWLLSDDVDPDDYRLAEVLVEHLCHRYGIQRRGKGDRFKNLESIYRRHLLPFLVELAWSLPAEQRGIAGVRLRHLESLPAVLAGDSAPPAATVAGDLLDRRGIACIFLSLDDAARVVDGGARALTVAQTKGLLAEHTDVRTGERIVSTADLRSAGLLLERTRPHGIATNTAGNVLSDLKLAIERGRGHGALVRGTFDLVATEPLAANRMRQPKAPSGYISVAAIAAIASYMPAIGQVVLWIARLLGERISEVFGLLVSDYWRDAKGRGWVSIDKQGGVSSLGRDPENGEFRRQDEKDHTKTSAGTRTIPIPSQLADLLDVLIAIFHTDAETGKVDRTARLIPGVQQPNSSGQSSVRGWLKSAQARTEVMFAPHDLRDALITDLKNWGVDERLAHYYAGHEVANPTIQDKYYDVGPDPKLLVSIAELLEQHVHEALGSDNLQVPTRLRDHWGRATRRYQQRRWIEEQLVAYGWRATEDPEPGRGALLSAEQVAAELGLSNQRTRLLMRTGAITAHTRPWGTREVWVAWEADVQRYQDASTGVTIAELAAEIGWTYHQVWQLLDRLELVDRVRPKGSALRLSGATADRIRREVACLTEKSRCAVPVREAADRLDVTLGATETLIRQGHLDIAAGHGTRRRLVTVESIDRFNALNPPTRPPGTDDHDDLLTMSATRHILRLTRPQLTTLIQTRQLTTGSREGSRHTYVTARSAIAWAERHALDSAVQALRAQGRES